MVNVSILIPHKNSVVSLLKLVDSIPDYIKIIIVDDFSTIENYNLLKSSLEALHNVNLIRNGSHPTNAGVARNICIQHCPINTEWVVFADADDLFITNALNRLIYKLNSLDADIVFFNCLAKKTLGNAQSNRVDTYRKLIAEYERESFPIAFSWPAPWGKAIKFRNILENNCLRFSSRLAGNDMEFSTKLALASKKVVVINEDVYVCYESGNSLSAVMTAEKSLERLSANIVCNRLQFDNGIAQVHYPYCVKYFIKSIPVIFKCKKISIVHKFLFNLLISLYMNARRKLNNVPFNS